jgi:hypothetical protein
MSGGLAYASGLGGCPGGLLVQEATGSSAPRRMPPASTTRAPAVSGPLPNTPPNNSADNRTNAARLCFGAVPRSRIPLGHSSLPARSDPAPSGTARAAVPSEPGCPTPRGGGCGPGCRGRRNPSSPPRSPFWRLPRVPWDAAPSGPGRPRAWPRPPWRGRAPPAGCRRSAPPPGRRRHGGQRPQPSGCGNSSRRRQTGPEVRAEAWQWSSWLGPLSATPSEARPLPEGPAAAHRSLPCG